MFQRGKLIIIPETFAPEDLITTSNLATQLERKYTDENDVFHSEPYLDVNGAGRWHLISKKIMRVSISFLLGVQNLLNNSQSSSQHKHIGHSKNT